MEPMRIAIVGICSFVISVIASEVVIRLLKRQPPLVKDFWDNFFLEFNSKDPRDREYIFWRYAVMLPVAIASARLLFTLAGAVFD